MNEQDALLKNIAQTAYNVGFGAKKHFATYDIVQKISRFINFISLAFGIYALIFDSLNVKYLSATLLAIGIIGMCTSIYNLEKYEATGKKIINLFYDLKNIRDKVKFNQGINLEDQLKRVEEIQQEFVKLSISEQIVFSNWYAHYKFFWETQIDWIDEELKFNFFRDKVPLSFSIFFIISILIIALFFYLIIYNHDFSYLVCYYLCNK